MRLDYPNYSGALATGGNLVFLGQLDGTFAAYDAKTLKQLWTSTSAPASMHRRSATR